MTLDGSGSSDVDGTITDWAWNEGANSLGSGETLETSLELGPHDITLTVTDDKGATASTTITVTVVDTTAPEITASLEWVAGKSGKSQKSKKGLFEVRFSCSDTCDDNPDVSAVATINGVEVTNGQIVELRLQGIPVDHLANRFRVSRRSIFRILNHNVDGVRATHGPALDRIQIDP